MSTTTATRIANTAMLRKIAGRRGLNRRIDPKLVKQLDPEGVHLLTILMPHEHAGGQAVELHWRCRAYLKLKGTDDAHEVIIDVLVKDWNALPTYADAVAAR